MILHKAADGDHEQEKPNGNQEDSREATAEDNQKYCQSCKADAG